MKLINSQLLNLIVPLQRSLSIDILIQQKRTFFYEENSDFFYNDNKDIAEEEVFDVNEGNYGVHIPISV